MYWPNERVNLAISDSLFDLRSSADRKLVVSNSADRTRKKRAVGQFDTQRCTHSAMRRDFRTNVRQDADLLVRAYRHYGAKDCRDYPQRRQSVVHF